LFVKNLAILFSYRKLTTPFAKSKKAGIQRRIGKIVKKIDRIRMTDEKTSIILNGTSPVKINIPFRRRRPAQNKRKRR